MTLISKDARAELYKVLSPAEQAMLDIMVDGHLVPVNGANKVRAFRIRQALDLLSPRTVIICVRGRGYSLRRLEA